jgi:hypothetical protein
MLRRILPWVTALLAVPLAVVPGIALGTGVDPADVLRAVTGPPTAAAVGALGDGAVAIDQGVLGAPGSPTSARARALAQIRLAAMLSHVGGFTPAQRWVMPLETYTLSEGFGVAGPHWSSGYHTGQDLAAAYGETVHAAHRGTVLYAGWAGRYGNLVTIGHEDGTQTWYAHLSRVLVRPGPVRTGQPIGEVGCTGNCFGTHLHFEVRLGPTLAVNPLLWLKLRGVDVPLSAAQIAAQPRTLPEAAQLAASPTGTSRPPRPQHHDPGGTTGPPGTDVGGGSAGGSTPTPSRSPTPRPSPSRTPSPDPSPSTPDPSPSTTPPPTDPGVTDPPPG